MGNTRSRCRPTFISLDVVAAGALGLTILVIVGLAAQHLAAAQSHSDARRSVRLAAEAELSLLRAGLDPLPPAGRTVTKQVGPLTIETMASAGTDAWRGFTLLRVVARRQVQGRHWARFELSTYVPVAERSP